MSRRTNKFSKAIKHIKSTEIDDKLAMLEAAPTNNTMGYMSTGVHGEPKPDTVTNAFPTLPLPDFDQDDPSENGRDTSGLFNPSGVHAEGTKILVVEPPGDTSYILGPMSAMYYTWSYPWTQIGYIRESDRKMVDLARIPGKLSDWDGVTGFNNSWWGGQLTLEQAVWFRDVKKYNNSGNDPADANYRAFYPGPPSNSPDAFGRYFCVTTGEAKNNDHSVPNPGKTEPIPGTASADEVFAAIMDRLRRGEQLSNDEKEFLDDYKIGDGDAKKGLFDNWKSQLGKLGLNLLRAFTDAAQFAGDFMFKGLPKGIEYLPDFTGGGLGITGGKKWADIIPFGKQLAGSNYATQYFTPSYQKAMQYAKEGGNVVVMPRTPGVQGWKNWLGSDVSRGFGFGDIEKLVQTSDTVANKNLTKIINLSDEGSVEALKALAKSGSKSNAVLAKLGKAVPFLNAGLVAADVTNRVNQGDYFGAVLGAVQIIPGPIGWISLGAQVAYDVEGHFNKNGFKGTVTGSRFESYIIEQQEINTEGMGQALIDAGLPKDKNEFIKQMGVQLTLQGLNPQFVSIILLSMAGKPLSSDQEKWVKENIEKMSNMFANAGEKNVKESYLSESRKTSILKNIKKPVVLPKEPKKFKVKPKLRTSNKWMGSSPKISKPVETPKEYKQIGGRNLWGKAEYNYNTTQSQERMNQVYELVGSGNVAFDYMLTDSKKLNDEQMEKFWGKNPDFYSYFYGGKKYKLVRKEAMDGDYLVFLIDDHGEKVNILQSELNEKVAEEQQKKELEEYNKMNPKEPVSVEKDYMFKKVQKRLKPQIDYKDKPAKMGYPNDPPPEMVNNRHPDFGKRPGTTAFNKLDPQSAAAMPQQDDETIDAKVKDAKENPKKDSAMFRRKLDDKMKKERERFNKEEWETSDWRKELESII